MNTINSEVKVEKVQEEIKLAVNERNPSDWAIVESAAGITATHTHGRVFEGTIKVFSAAPKA